MMEDQYLELADQYIITDFLIKVLERDKQHFQTFKLGLEYTHILDEKIIEARKDMYELKKNMYRNQVKVLETEGQFEDFVYYEVWKGQKNTPVSFHRKHLRNRVGQLLKYYLIGDEIFFGEEYYAPQT
ncbi:hypothetical protein [Salibacterium sp. K-3]